MTGWMLVIKFGILLVVCAVLLFAIVRFVLQKLKQAKKWKTRSWQRK